MRLLTLIVSVCAAATFGAPAASAQDYFYCVENDTDLPIVLALTSRDRDTIQPGRDLCCTSRCQNPISVGFDLVDQPSLGERLRDKGLDRLSATLQLPLYYARNAARVRLTVPGAPNMAYYDNYRPFCQINWQYNDRVEVRRSGDTYVCDVGNRITGHVRTTIGASGASTPDAPTLRLCNEARDGTAFVATAHRDVNSVWVSEGWYVIDEGQCENLAFPSGYRGYAYAHVNTDTYTWDDADHHNCVHPSRSFSYRNSDRRQCEAGAQRYPFMEFDMLDGRDQELVLTAP